jgi:hypothetical protein
MPTATIQERRNAMLVFSSLAEALRAGFQIFDRTSTGYLVRIKTARGWALALVELR